MAEGRFPTRDYVAGLYEGEGNIRCNHNGRSKGYTTRSVIVAIRMCDREPLDMVAAFAGGTVRTETPPKNPEHRQSYRWTLSNPAECRAFIGAIGDLLSPRRQEQAWRAFEEYELVQMVMGREIR